MSLLEITTPAQLKEAFGDLGTHVGPRVGSDARTKAQEKWWCFRRYVFTLAAANLVEFPISITKPERPDFRCSFGPRQIGVEITQQI